MTNLEKLQKEHLESPLKVGDDVYIFKNRYSYNYLSLVDLDNSKFENGSFKIENIDNDVFTLKSSYTGKSIQVLKDFISQKSVWDIGYNPFPNKSWLSAVKFFSRDLDGVLYSIIGYTKRLRKIELDKVENVEIEEINWNPFVIDSNGNKVFYQRPFVWSLNDKKLLIESIINGIEIGKVIIRKRSYKWIQNEIKNGNFNVAFKDVVDGKQRLKTLLEFLLGEFCDVRGIYFYDYSEEAKSKFMNYSGITCGELGEESSDEDVKQTFLGINFAGVPMSQEHIEFVKSINL